MMTEFEELNSFSAPFIFSYKKIDHIFFEKSLLKKKKCLSCAWNKLLQIPSIHKTINRVFGL